MRADLQKSWSIQQEWKSLEDAHKTAIVNIERVIAKKDKKIAEMDLELDELMVCSISFWHFRIQRSIQNCESDRTQLLEEERQQLLRDYQAAELREAVLTRRVRDLEAQVASLIVNDQKTSLKRNHTVGALAVSKVSCSPLVLAKGLIRVFSLKL